MSAPAAPEKVQPPPPDAAVSATDGAVAIKGRTPWEIVRSRLARDKITMTAFVFSVLIVVVAATSPFMVKLGWLRPDDFNPALVQGLGSLPEGFAGGISRDHWLGVEPGTGGGAELLTNGPGRSTISSSSTSPL